MRDKIFNEKLREILQDYNPIAWMLDDSGRLIKKGVWNYARFFIALGIYFSIIIFTAVTCICVSLPFADDVSKGQCFEFRSSFRSFEKTVECTLDSYPDVIPFSIICGVYDPTKEFISLYGFSCSYQNYIRSTAYKFT